MNRYSVRSEGAKVVRGEHQVFPAPFGVWHHDLLQGESCDRHGFVPSALKLSVRRLLESWVNICPRLVVYFGDGIVKVGAGVREVTCGFLAFVTMGARV